MISGIDKALVALLCGATYALNYFMGGIIPVVSEGTATAIIGAVTPILVWLVPNRSVP